MKENQINKQYLDATKPDAEPVSHTSKPSIVKNQTAHRDPMTVKEEDSNIIIHQHKKIDPSPEFENENTKTSSELKPPEASDTKPGDLQNEEDSKTTNTIPEHSKQEDNSNLTESSTTSHELKTKDSIDSTDGESQANNKDEISESSETPALTGEKSEFSEQSKELQDLINKKTYNLPIKKAGSKNVTVIAICIVLAICVLGLVFLFIK